jgi:hypothetical protein
MNSKPLERLLIELPPKRAIKEIARIIKTIFPLLEEQARIDFVTSLIGETGDDKVASMVHL